MDKENTENVTKKEVSWWVAIIMIIVSAATFTIGNITSLNQRVTKNEEDISDIKDLIKDHTDAQNVTSIQLGILDSNVKTIMTYFKLKPKESNNE